MIPLQSLSLEHYGDKNCEYCERNDLLNDFQLHQIEGTSVFDESDSIGRHLSAIFEECDSPGEEDHYDQRPA